MFSLASSNIAQTPNIAQTQGRDSSDRQSHRTTTSVKIIGAAAIALLASANTFASAGENSPRMAQEHHACAVVMGLHQPGDLYEASTRACLSWIKRDWRGATEAHVPGWGLSRVRRLSRSAW